MSQIALISDQHNDDIRIGVISQLLQPSCYVLVCLVFADIVNEQSSDGTSVVCRCDGTVSLLPSSIPDLCLNGLRIYLNRPGCELDADGGLGV